MSERSIQLEWDERPVIVTYYVVPEEAATREYPGSPGCIEIECVENEKGRAVDLLENEYAEIEDMIAEILGEENPQADYADHLRDRMKDEGCL